MMVMYNFLLRFECHRLFVKELEEARKHVYRHFDLGTGNNYNLKR